MRISHSISVALFAAAALGLTACSAPEENDAASPSVVAEAGALPVTIEHAYGSTTFTTAPTRVAAMGVGDADTLLALGIRPVAVATFGDPPEVKTPWTTDLFGDDNPVALAKAANEFGSDVAKALGTQPDLVTAVGADPTRAQNEQLSSAVPTLVRPKDSQPWLVPWDVQATEIGKAVGQPEAIAEKIDETTGYVDDLIAKHPNLTGKTAVAATASADGSISIFGPGDGRAQALQDYGLAFPEGLKSAVTSGFYGTISAENVGLLNQADIVVMLDWQGANDKVKANQAWNRQTFVTEGRTAYLDQEVGTAMSVPTVLSIPWVADRAVPQIADAAK